MRVFGVPLPMMAVATTLAATCIGSWASSPASASGAGLAYHFNEYLLANGTARGLDLERFALGNPVAAGTYRAEVFVNERWLGRFDVLIGGFGGQQNRPCIDGSLFSRLKIDPARLSEQGAKLMAGGESGESKAGPRGLPSPRCVILEEVLEGGRAVFDEGEMRLDVVVPQAALARHPAGYVAPEYWDTGVNAAILSYRLDALEHNNGFRSSVSYFGSTRLRANLGAWQLVHDGAFSGGNLRSNQYRPIATSVRRHLPDWRANLMIGDVYSDGALFQSASVQGLSIMTDERMLPESQRGYAPVVRGQARTNAKIEVRQNGVLVHEVMVPPGPFELNDLYPTGLGGDLEITVVEADGAKDVFRVPFSAMPMSLREGAWRVQWVAGAMRDSVSNRAVSMGTAQYGLSNALTVNVGAILAESYQSGVLGGALNTPFGAWSVDGYLSMTGGSPVTYGHSVRLGWSKYFEGSQTNLSVAAYRYASRGYFELDRADRELNGVAGFGYASLHERSRVAVSINQRMGRWGSLFLRGQQRQYWDESEHDSSLQASYGFQLGRASITVGYSSERWPGRPKIERGMLTFNLPFGAGTSRPGAVAGQYIKDEQGGDYLRSSVSGALGAAGELLYQVGANRATNGVVGTTFNANLDYKTPVAMLGGSTTRGSDWYSNNLRVHGGLVAHAGGLTFGPYVGDTVGLVHVDRSDGLAIKNVAGGALDSSGYAILPYLSPYQQSTIELDLARASPDVEFESVTQQVVPVAGAVVAVGFKAKPGRLVWVKARLPGGASLPMGAMVLDREDRVVGAVGQAGRLQARLLDTQGELTVTWPGITSKAAANRCRIDYVVPDTPANVVPTMQATCVPSSAR